MTDSSQQPIDHLQFRVDDSFYIAAYQKWEHYDEPYVSLLHEGNYYPVYNKLLYEFLSSDSVALLYPSRQVINGRDYAKSYVEGFRAGLVDFDKYFPTSAFHGVNADALVNDLHRKCLHQFNEVLEGDGWIEAARQIPYLINHSTVKYFGFFTAKLASYDQLLDNYKELFEKLIQPEYVDELPEQRVKPTITKPRKSVEVAILPKAQDRVYEALKPFVLDKKEHVALSGLIRERILPSKPITVNTNQNTIAYFFKTLFINNLMSESTKTDIAKWICSSFSETTFITVYGVLKDKMNKKKPAKGSRIDIKLDDL